MKRNLHLLTFALIVLLSSCKDDDKASPDLSKVKIASISGIGNFVYDGDRLVTVGNEKLIYDSKGILVESRVSKTDTVRSLASNPLDYFISYTYLKSSYSWHNNYIKSRNVDTLITSASRGEDSGFPGDPRIETLSTNLPGEEYYYKNDQIDSISYFAYQNKQSEIHKSFFYSSSDVIKMREYRPVSFPFSDIITEFEESETEFEYDNHPNPFNIIYKQTGVILSSLKDFNFSAHNPVKVKIKTIKGSIPVNASYTITYEYNNAGLPVKINFNGGYYNGKSINIKYH